MEPSDKPEKAKLRKDNGQESIEVSPIQLLGIILRIVLKDRITDEEIEAICSTYYDTINEWWSE